ncbi:leucine-rich repeats and IQ motif containing 3 [Cichlidogyrus casuarinus]|uniref:Leucine-rich repeats and IQ motif containing 3 n=1 Tax=Cichlidogyrus casuarinus TaxID=1844966 RepID=A0ABD2Q0B6_9PLAT
MMRYQNLIGMNLPLLTTLSIRGSGLLSIDMLFQCRNLVLLDISTNYIKSIDPLYEAVNLVYLNASHNDITEIPSEQWILNLSKLAILYLNDNQIVSIKCIEALSQLQSLIHLDLSDCPVTLSRNYRHLAVNSIPSLKALDSHLISDEEIIEGANFRTSRFRTFSPFLKLKRLPFPDDIFIGTSFADPQGPSTSPVPIVNLASDSFTSTEDEPLTLRGEKMELFTGSTLFQSRQLTARSIRENIRLMHQKTMLNLAPSNTLASIANRGVGAGQVQRITKKGAQAHQEKLHARMADRVKMFRANVYTRNRGLVDRVQQEKQKQKERKQRFNLLQINENREFRDKLQDKVDEARTKLQMQQQDRCIKINEQRVIAQDRARVRKAREELTKICIGQLLSYGKSVANARWMANKGEKEAQKQRMTEMLKHDRTEAQDKVLDYRKQQEAISRKKKSVDQQILHQELIAISDYEKAKIESSLTRGKRAGALVYADQIDLNDALILPPLFTLLEDARLRKTEDYC